MREKHDTRNRLNIGLILASIKPNNVHFSFTFIKFDILQTIMEKDLMLMLYSEILFVAAVVLYSPWRPVPNCAVPITLQTSQLLSITWKRKM